MAMRSPISAYRFRAKVMRCSKSLNGIWSYNQLPRLIFDVWNHYDVLMKHWTTTHTRTYDPCFSMDSRSRFE